MSNFRVGQKVVCVDDSPSANPRSTITRWLVLNHVYTVVHVSYNYGVILQEDPEIILHTVTKARIGCRHARFRPAVERKTDISIFTKMLTDARSKEPAQ